MEVCSPSGQFAALIDLHPIDGAHQPDKRSFSRHLPTGNAGALRHMLGAGRCLS
jgi:hypothetical protein